MQGPNQKERPNYVHTAGQTGGKTTARKLPIPFYGVQISWQLEKPLRGYGWDPNQTANVVRIVYRPLDKDASPIGEPSVVAGYISVANVNLSEVLQDNKYRIGVAVSDVADAIAARCDMARQLINQAISKQLLARARDLELKLDLLKVKLSEVHDLMDVGLTHIVLATGWRV
jgi:hypothetical protein